MRLFNLTNIRSITLALVPILGIYKVLGVVSLDFVLLSLVFILGFNSSSLDKKIILFFATILLISLISFAISASQSESLYINNTIQVLGFGVLLSHFVNSKINELFPKALINLAILATVFIFYQSISYYFFGSPAILFLPFNMGLDDENLVFSIFWGRPHSFFLEPAHYCIYILPVFYYTLKKSNRLISIFLLAGMLISTSTTGFFIAIFLILYHTLKFKKNIKYIIIIVTLCIISMIFLNEMIAVILEKNLSKLDTSSLNDNIRIFGAFSLIELIDNFSIYFGLGHNQLSSYMALKNIDVKNYANSLLMCFFSFGVFGFISFVLLLKYLFKVNEEKGYFLILILVLLSDQILFNQNLFYLISCIYLLNVNGNIKEINNLN